MQGPESKRATPRTFTDRTGWGEPDLTVYITRTPGSVKKTKRVKISTGSRKPFVLQQLQASLLDAYQGPALYWLHRRPNRMSPHSTCFSHAAAVERPLPAARRPRLSAVGLTGALVGTAVLVAAAPALLHARRPQDRERAMYVTVADPNGAPVTGLKPDDFVVREDGSQREVLRVEPATAPIEITLVLDNSDVAAPAIADLRRAVTAFIKESAKGNDIAMTTIGGRPQTVQNYTGNRELLDRAVGRLFAEPGSGAYVLEALSSVAGGVAKRAPERAVILAILVRSAPEFSNLPYQTVVKALRDCGATFDAIVLETGPPAPPPTTGEQATAIHDRDTVLDEASRATGGVNVQALSSMALTPELTSIAVQLRNQYRVVYARPESLIPPEKIDVAVKKPGRTARGTPVKVPR
jgi:VWFA-related protein